jgi:hypothetical protein
MNQPFADPESDSEVAAVIAVLGLLAALFLVALIL